MPVPYPGQSQVVMYCGAGDFLFVEGTAYVADLHLKKDTCLALLKEQISKRDASEQRG